MQTRRKAELTFSCCVLLSFLIFMWARTDLTDQRRHSIPASLREDKAQLISRQPMGHHHHHHPLQELAVNSAGVESQSGDMKESLDRNVSQVLLRQTILHVKSRLKNTATLDKSGQYYLLNNFLTPRTAVTSSDNYDVTVTTHCTSNHLHYAATLSERWQGPVSFAVFTYDGDVPFTIATTLHYHLCSTAVAEHVSFHLSFPANLKPESVDGFVNLAVSNFTCSRPPENKKRFDPNYCLKDDIPYPTNLVRNLALKNANTSHVMLADVDMLPSAGLRPSFIKLLSREDSDVQVLEGLAYSSPQLAFVLPVLEVKRGKSFPKTKQELLGLWMRHEAQPFNLAVCPHCQSPTDYDRWASLERSEELQVAYPVRYKFEYEPFVIVHSSVPVYDERFKSFGYNGISHACELHMAGYNFAVLNNAFLVHDGFHERGDTRPAVKDRMNAFLYQIMQQELRLKYNKTSRRCVTSGKKLLRAQ